MKNKKTSFRSIAWLASVTLLLAWLAGMSFATYTQADSYFRQITAVGKEYAARFTEWRYLECYVDSRHPQYQELPNAQNIIELRMMDAIGYLAGDMSQREYLLTGQKVPADASVIVYDRNGQEYLCSTDFAYIIYTNQENWEKCIESSDGNLWLDFGRDTALREAIAQLPQQTLSHATVCITGSVEGSRIIPTQMSYTTDQKPWSKLALWHTVLDREPVSEGQACTIYAQYFDIHFQSEMSGISYQGQRYESLTDLLRGREDKNHTYGDLLRLYVFSEDYLYSWESGQESVAYTVETVVACSPILMAMHALAGTYAATFALLLAAALILLWVIHRNLTKPLAILNAHRAGRWQHIPQEKTQWREPLELEQRFAELDETVKAKDDELRRKENEINRLNRALAYAKQAEDNRRRMVSAVAHELKTPLAVIHGYTEGLQERIAEEKRDQYLATILGETERMDELVMEMLDLSRLEAGKVKLARDRFSLTELTRSVFDKLSLEAEKKELRIEYEWGTDQICADEGRLQQVILNLASNAVRYTPEGGRIQVRTRRHNGTVSFSMENEAPAFTAEELASVWETFYRTDRARSGKGTGLGLAIARNIVALHGGSCAVRNTDTGVEFSFRIPQI